MRNTASTSLPLLLLSLTLSLPVAAMSLLQPDTAAGLAQADAEEAFENGDKRLLGVMTRSLSVPAVDPGDVARVQQQCGIRKIQRGDVIADAQSLQNLRQRGEYLDAYNRRMLTLCLP